MRRLFIFIIVGLMLFSLGCTGNNEINKTNEKINQMNGTLKNITKNVSETFENKTTKLKNESEKNETEEINEIKNETNEKKETIENKTEEFKMLTEKEIKSMLPDKAPKLTGLPKGNKKMAIFTNKNDYSISAYNGFNYHIDDQSEMDALFLIKNTERGIEKENFYENCLENKRNILGYEVCYLDANDSEIENSIYYEASHFKPGKGQTYYVYILLNNYTYASITFTSMSFNIAEYLTNESYKPFEDAISSFNFE